MSTGRGPLEALRRHASQRPSATAFIELDRHGVPIETRDYAGLLARVAGVAAALGELTSPGRAVAIPLGNSIAFAEAFLGCMEAGRPPVPLPPVTTRRSAERQAAILAAAKPGAVVVSGPPRGSPLFEDLPAIDLRDVQESVPRAAIVTNSSEIAFIQFTSGTTGVPRGIAISHDALAANLGDIRDALGYDHTWRSVNWLPPFHDMGLINGYLAPVTEGAMSILTPTLHTIQRPLIWLAALSRYRASLSFAPNFMYAACVDRIRETDRTGLDLSGWRVAGCGAERVDPATLRRFAEAYRRHGFDADALFPAYGLAEATLYVTGPRLGEGLRDFDADPVALAGGRAVVADLGVRLASCGSARGSTRVRIVRADTGAEAAEGEVGIIRLSGPSLAAGHWTIDGLEPLPRESSDPGGAREIDTGDLGFLLDGRLFPVTRHDDVLIHRGRKLLPDLLEASALAAAGDIVCAGAVAFRQGAGTDGFVVAIEVPRATDPQWVAGLALRIRRHLAAAEGAAPHVVLIVKEGTLPRTTSGKIARHRCAADYASGDWPAAAATLDIFAGEKDS